MHCRPRTPSRVRQKTRMSRAACIQPGAKGGLSVQALELPAKPGVASAVVVSC